VSASGTRACAASSAPGASTPSRCGWQSSDTASGDSPALYDHLCATARLLHAEVCARPDFEALHAPESNIICFRYVGTAALQEDELDALNMRLRTAYNRGGDGWITTTLLGGRRALRATLMNPRTTASDVTRVLDGLAQTGQQLASAE